MMFIVALKCSLKSGRVIIPALLFYSQDCFSNAGYFSFHTSFRIICSSPIGYVMGIWIRIALNLLIALGSMPI